MSGDGGEMLELRFHFGERDRAGDRALDVAVMDACERRGVRAAALLRAVEGFGGRQRLRTERLLSLSEDAPLVAVAVGEAAVIETLATEIEEIASGGMVSLEPVRVLGARHDAIGVGGDGSAETTRSGGEGSAGGAPGDTAGGVVKATIWGPRSGSASPHLDAVAALKRCGAAAATVLLGVDGVLDGERRRGRFVGANRGVPAMTVAVGERGAISAALAELNASPHLVTVEAVESSSRIERASHHTEGVERKSVIDRGSHHGTPATRITLGTTEIAEGDSQPLYLGLIQLLRAEGASGATALRGVWGFHGDREPHGDRVLALRRDVPMLVEAVDAPGDAARWGELARRLAGDAGVVYSQAIPRILTLD